MPVIAPNAPTVNVQLPVPTPVAQRPRAQPVPAAARPTLQTPPPMAPREPSPTSFILPWRPAAKAALPRRWLRRTGEVVKLAGVRRKPADYAGFIRHLFENPRDTTAASVLADWFADRGMYATEEVIRRNLATPMPGLESAHPELSDPPGWRIGFNNPTTRREQAGSWNSRFYVYAPQATGRMGGDPYTYTHLTFRHPDDRKRALSFGFAGTEAEGARMVDALEKEGHEPYHPSGHGHDAFRAARPELFPKPPVADQQSAERRLRRGPKRYAEHGYTHADFINKIAESPHDRTPPLVYADWLDEQGHSAVAEVIRRAMERHNEAQYTMTHFNPAEWTGFAVPWGHVGPSAYMPTPFMNLRERTPNGGHRKIKNPQWKVGVNVLWRFSPADAQRAPSETTDRHLYAPRGVGMATTPEDAHRLFSQMRDRGILHADKAVARLEKFFPHLKTPPAVDQPPPDPQHLRRRVLRYAASDRAAFEAAIDRDPTDATTHLVYSDWLRDNGEDDEADFRKAMGEWVGDPTRGKYPQVFPYDVHPTENNGFTHGIWRSNLPAWASDPNAPPSVSGNFVERTRQEPHLAYAPNSYWLHWRGRQNMEEGLRRAFRASRQRPQPMRRRTAR